MILYNAPQLGICHSDSCSSPSGSIYNTLFIVTELEATKTSLTREIQELNVVNVYYGIISPLRNMQRPQKVLSEKNTYSTKPLLKFKNPYKKYDIFQRYLHNLEHIVSTLE